MRTACIILALVLIPLAQAVVIQEVYPNPVRTETGGEAVLLYNNADADVDISGWTIGTPSSATDATIPANTVLGPDELYLVADAGWSTLKDNADWANASYEEAITLSNTGGTMTLRDNSTVMDTIAYPAAEDGIAYWREGGALVATEPLFTGPLSSLYLLTLAANNTQNSTGKDTEGITVTDDGKAARTVRPLPGKTKYLNVTVSTPDQPVVTFLGQSYATQPAGDKTYVTSVPLDYYTPPGSYNITAFTDKAVSYQIEVSSLLAVESDAASLQLGDSTSRNITISGDAEFGTPGLTLRNIGNVDVDVLLSRTSLRHGDKRIAADIIAQSDKEPVNVTTSGSYLTTIGPRQAAPLTLILSLPDDAPSGDYAMSFALQLKKT